MNKRISLCFAILLATLSPTTSQARYLNPNTGRFQTMDSYEGNNQDPQSLHKYHYCHDNPVNAVDPSGHYGMLEMWVLDSVRTYYWASASPSAIAIGTGTAGPDVTRAIKRTLLDVEAKFYTWTRNQKIDAGLKMRDFWGSVGSLATGGGAKAWDILGLYGASQDDPYLITEKNHYPTGRGAGAKTVTFNGKSYYAGAVNYAMWGKMNKLLYDYCLTESTDARLDPYLFELETAIDTAECWKHIAYLDFGIQAMQAEAFTTYGYNGTLSAPSCPVKPSEKALGAEILPWCWEPNVPRPQ